MNNKSEIFERIVQFSMLKGFKNLNDFSNYVGFTSPEKLYRLGRSDKNKPSFNMLLQISNTFEDLNLNWLIKGTGNITTQNVQENEALLNPVVDSITNLFETITRVNDAGLRKSIALLQEQIHGINENEKEIKEKVDYIYNEFIKAELSKDIQKTIDKIKE